MILRQLLDGPIRVMPYMRVDGKRVVPRLEFTLNLVAAFPPVVAGPLALAGQGARRRGRAAGDAQADAARRCVCRAAAGEACRLIVERRLEGKTYKAIAKELDLTKYHMENCARITRLMEEAGPAGALLPADGEARPCAAVVQQALAEGGRPQGWRQATEGVLTRGRVNVLVGQGWRLWAPPLLFSFSFRKVPW